MSEVVSRLKPDNVTRLKPARIDPEAMAVEAIGYIAADHERLRRFLDVSGIEASAIRQAAEMPGFFLGVLDYVTAHEWLVIGLAERANVRPEAILHARDALAPRNEAD